MCHIDSFKLKSEPINHTTSYPSTVICSLQTGVEMAHCMPLQFQCSRIGCSQSPFVLQSMPGQQRCRCELPRTQKRLYMIRPKIAWNIVRKPGVGNPEFLHHRLSDTLKCFSAGHRQVDRCLFEAHCLIAEHAENTERKPKLKNQKFQQVDWTLVWDATLLHEEESPATTIFWCGPWPRQIWLNDGLMMA